jgi:hypothetical protein
MPLTAPEPKRHKRSRVVFPDSTEVARRLECTRAYCSCHVTAQKGHGVTHCPGKHQDDHPSLSISQRGEMTIWRCHAGCSQLEVRDGLIELGVWPKI